MSQQMKISATRLLAQLHQKGVTLWEENGGLRYKAPQGTLSDIDIQALRDHKTEIIEILQKETNPMKVIPAPESRYSPFPLSDMQSAYLLGRGQWFGFGGVACHIYLEINYPDLDLERTENVWNQIIRRHDMLRAIFDQNGYQQVLENVPDLKIAYTDLSGWQEQEAAAKLAAIREDMGHRIYDTARWPLFDIGVTKMDNGTLLHFSMDFLIADWLSMWMLVSEFEIAYEKREQHLPDLPFTFRDYIEAERKMKETTTYLRDRDYWLKRVDTLPSAPDLPMARQKEESVPARFRRRSFQLDSHSWEVLKQRTQNHSLTPTVAVMATYAAVIERWSRNDQFCLNLTLLNRLPLHPQINEIVGDFTSVNLLEFDWNQTKSFVENAQAVQKQLFEDLEYRLFPGVEVLREVARRRGKEAALMPVVFTSAIGLVDSVEKRALKGKINENSISQTPQLFIDCQAMDDSYGLRVNWDVREGVFPEQMVDNMFNSFTDLLHSLAMTDSIWDKRELISLPAWQLSERKQINETATPLSSQSLHTQVLAQAMATPNQPAVIDQHSQMSYQELGQKAAAVAEELKSSGCVIQDRVAIVMPKCADQVAAVLGALSAGAVYVPIDIHQPELRRLELLKHADVRFVLTHSNMKVQWPEHLKSIVVDQLEPAREFTSISDVDPDLPAYIIYTSGSTGTPKGVVISHRGAANTVQNINRHYNIGANDRVLGLAHLGFDLSVYDIFGPLSTGGSLVYPNPDQLANPSHWADVMLKHEVTVWNSVPASMQMLIDYVESNPQNRMPHLRLTMLSGDWVPLTLPDRIVTRFANAQVVCLGGATEASIWSIYHIYSGLHPEWQSIPYGRPLANQKFHVFDSDLRDCPVWVTGELYISGQGLAEGYWKDEKASIESFFKHPVDGRRLYRTGDLGRYLPGGEIEFLGRQDHQVKIRGHRIELGEIESTLTKHPAVAVSSVVVDGSDGDKSLLGIVELGYKSDRNVNNEKSAYDRLVCGLDALASVETEGISKEEVNRAVENLETAALHSMLYALCQLGVFSNGNEYSMEEILQCEGIHAQHQWLVRRWVNKLTEAGLLLEGCANQFSCSHQPDKGTVNDYWELAETSWHNKLASTEFISYVRSNTEQLPELLSGQQNPVNLLFPEGKMDYVRALYVKHAMSNYLNQCMSTLLHRIAEKQSGKTLRILEVGAGSGATTEKVLQALKGVTIDYLFTDVSSFFIPGAESRFGAYEEVKYGTFDVDQDYRAQGLTPNDFDIVLAAGVLENARDIPASMKRLTELLCPGGWLVFTEPTMEHAWILASQAFMMTEPEDHLRTETSFLDRRGWMQLLEQHGDEPILCLPGDEHPLSPMGVHLFAKQCKQDKLSVSVSDLADFLSDRLPAYMVPSHIQIVDTMPLTSNNKVDRRELATWRPRPMIEHTANDMIEESLDTLEAMLSDVWADALSVPRIGSRQNVYNHGADSLIMAQVAGKLRDLLAVDGKREEIPFDALLRQMLNYPTVAALAEFIRSYKQQTEPVENLDQVVSIQRQDQFSNAVLTSYGGGESGPLRVVFHAGLGTMNGFHMLLEHLIAEKIGPVIGITVADTEKYCAHEPSELIEILAEGYAASLLDREHEEMQLIGYSLGGLIAIEVARRLVEKGMDVLDIVLVDSHPVLFDIEDDLIIESLFIPNFNITFEQAGFGRIDPDDFQRALVHIFETNNRSVPQGSSCTAGGDAGLERVGELFRSMSDLSVRDRFKAYTEAIARETDEQIPVEMAEGLFQMYRQSLKAARFLPEPYLGNIRLLLADDSFGFVPGLDQMTLHFWQDICLGSFEVIKIVGNHFSCMKQEPNVTNLSEIISAPFNER
ncbi:non-ribosomal peptide synthetase [Paenibacillus sp.]|uniref:non-ribosomal peptide synthetase n=1 Tax=Paenibacillus sp. TaxID=58172 RepID=UPI00283AA0DA|nr:non-ribosomal peptide synthetase [Paenibacillus sp.]